MTVFKIEVQCKMLMGKFSPTSFDHTKTMLLPQFGSRWKVWNKYEIRGAHGSGGIGNGRNRDFGAPARHPASEPGHRPASQPASYWQSNGNLLETNRNLLGINRNSLGINRNLLEINRNLLKINRNLLESIGSYWKSSSSSQWPFLKSRSNVKC